ncbi:hypothetical protein OIU34_29535 [Pararhizobium sp. BT-229]|nr:hypothetical protein [Pararhizobium sp. BT-229]MCV9966017.1 hypothetical protein [Pararhizobium sp. BT-229]
MNEEQRPEQAQKQPENAHPVPAFAGGLTLSIGIVEKKQTYQGIK